MASRLDFQVILENILGSRNVYHNPPPNTFMEYPCIRYKLDDVRVQHAGDRFYVRTKRYQVTYISTDPDSTIPDQLAELQLSAFDRFYTADHLNHTVYNIFF